MPADERDRFALARHNEGPGATHHFTGDNYNLTFAGLFLSEPPVLTIGFPVLRFDVTAEVSAIAAAVRTERLGIVRGPANALEGLR
jgi:hypothetical protein